MKKSVLGIICARSGSKRFPKKNLKIIGGKSLLEIATETLCRSNVDLLVLATDFKPDFELSKYGAEHLKRASNISSNYVPLQETVKWAYYSLNRRFDYITFLMPNCPAIGYEDVNAALDLAISKELNVVRSYNSKGEENGLVIIRTGYLEDHFIDVYCGAIIAEGDEIHNRSDYLKVKEELEKK